MTLKESQKLIKKLLKLNITEVSIKTPDIKLSIKTTS
jgi:hypothetical protein